jgi:uncharacterized protein YbaP (TraB family)
MKRLLASAVLALLPLGAGADDAPPPVQDWSNNIETVVVNASAGPLIWHVRKGEADLYIFGIVTPAPEKMAWNDNGLRAILKDAKQMLLPPGATVGVFEGVWFLMWNRDALYLPDDTKMENTISEPLRKRFIAVRDRLHQDPDRYEDLRVPLAALRLESDWQKANQLSYREIMDHVEGVARKAGVRSRRVATYEALPIVKQLPKMTQAGNDACMKAALDDIAVLEDHAVAAAEAWAVGNLAGVKGNYSDARFEACVQALPSAGALFARSVTDSVNAANQALATPGKTVMVVSMGQLLRQGGVLDRLKAEGLTVEAPQQ